MWSRIKFYLFMAAAGAAAYFLLSHHVIFYGHEASVIKDVYLLKKSKLNLHYTFFSLHQKKPDAIMKIKPLRKTASATYWWSSAFCRRRRRPGWKACTAERPSGVQCIRASAERWRSAPG